MQKLIVVLMTIYSMVFQQQSSLNMAMQVLPPTSVIGTVFIATNGSDSNPCTAVLPCLTPQKATNVLRTKPAGQRIAVFRGGTYPLTSAWSLADASGDSGTAANGVIYTNYPGEVPVISGGKQVTGWAACTGGTCPNIPTLTCGGSCTAYKVNLTAASWNNFEALYYNGTRRFRPSTTDAPITSTWLTQGAAVCANASSSNCPQQGLCGAGKFQCYDRITRQGSDTTTTFHGMTSSVQDVETYVMEKWTGALMRAAPSNADGNACTTSSTQLCFTGRTLGATNSFGPMPNHHYLLVNTRENLTKATEWYLDRCPTGSCSSGTESTWTLYYMAAAGENPTTDTVYVPQTSKIMNAVSLQYVTFAGLVFSHDNFVVGASGQAATSHAANIPAAMTCTQCSNVIFNQDTWSHTGNWAVEFVGAGMSGGGGGSGTPVNNDFGCATNGSPTWGSTDGPASLPTTCMKTARSFTPSNGTLRHVTDSTTLASALAAMVCGDIVQFEADFTNTNVVLPAKACDATHWITFRSDGIANSQFPAEGIKVTPCYWGVASLPGRPNFNCASTTKVGRTISGHITGNSSVPFTITAGSSFYRIEGLEITVPVGNGFGVSQLTKMDGTDHIIWDQNWIHGTAADEIAHGVILKNSTWGALVDNFINDLHCKQGGQCADSTGISGGVDNVQTGPFKIVDNFVEASAENIIFGGGAATTIPADMLVLYNYLFKPLIWNPASGSYAGIRWVVKNNFEMKNGNRILVQYNYLENAWAPDQVGSAFLLTPRSPSQQSPTLPGTCPTCQTEHVTFRWNYVTGQNQFLQAGNTASAPCSNNCDPAGGHNYSVHDNIADNQAPPTANASGATNLWQGNSQSTYNAAMALHDVSVINNTVVYANPTAGGSWPTAFMNMDGPCVNDGTNCVPGTVGSKIAIQQNLTVRDNVVSAGQFAMNGAASGTMRCGSGESTANMTAWVADCWSGTVTWDYNCIVGGVHTGWNWPGTHNKLLAAGYSSVQFVNYNNGVGGDYHLQSGSACHNASSTGGDMGADISTVIANTITAGVNDFSGGSSGGSSVGNTIKNSAFFDMGVGGVRLGLVPAGGDTDANVSQYNTINNNVLVGGQRVMPGGTGIAVAIQNSHHNTVTNNTMYDWYNGIIEVGASQGAVGASGCPNCSLAHDNNVSFNLLYDVGQGVTSDMGCIHAASGTQTGNVFDHNVCHDVTQDLTAVGYGGQGIYLDQSSSNWTVSNNLVYRTSECSIQINSPDNLQVGNTLSNNIFAYGRQCAIKKSSSSNTALVFSAVSTIIYFDKGNSTHGWQWDSGGPQWQCGATCTSVFSVNKTIYFYTGGNLSTNTQGFLTTDSAGNKTYYNFAGWQGGSVKQDLNSFVTDPKFVGPSFAQGDNYSFQGGAPNGSINFTPIDVTVIGANTLLIPSYQLVVPASFPLNLLDKNTGF